MSIEEYEFDVALLLWQLDQQSLAVVLNILQSIPASIHSTRSFLWSSQLCASRICNIYWLNIWIKYIYVQIYRGWGGISLVYISNIWTSFLQVTLCPSLLPHLNFPILHETLQIDIGISPDKRRMSLDLRQDACAMYTNTSFESSPSVLGMCIYRKAKTYILHMKM